MGPQLRKLFLVIVLVVAITSAASIGIAYVFLRPPNSTQIIIHGVVLNVEIARTPAELQRGLSGRASMGSNNGMLFVFDHSAMWSFWMKDMKFSLDMIWFDSNRRAVFIEQSLPPCLPQSCPIYTPTSNAMYVLEVNAGFVQAHGISLGETFDYV